MGRYFYLVFIPVSIMIYLNLFEIIGFVNQYIYQFYSLDWYGFTGFSFNNLILPIMTTTLILFLELNLDKRNIQFDKIKFYRRFFLIVIILTIFSTKIQILYRLKYIFEPVVFIYIPYMITRQKNKEISNIVVFTFIFLIIIAHLIAIYRSEYNPFIFESLFNNYLIL